MSSRTALLLALSLLLAACTPERPPNVLLVTLDTTRADFLGAYGKESARTPHLDQLAADGFLFEHAYASHPVTQPSHSTILTGVYPMVHGVRDNGLFQLPDSRRTLAEILRENGFATGAAVGGFPLTAEFGTAQGFDFYDDDLTADRLDHRGRPVARSRQTWYDERPAGHVNDAILPWLRGLDGRPFFAWIHYWDPHEPHIAPQPWGELFAHDPYQGEIAYADQSLGTILGELERRGELERTVVVVTADHGEGRHEHDEITHAFLAYDTTLHVPLILRVPGREGGVRVAERVGTVDIVPTVLDLLDLPPPAEVQGRSLVPLMEATPGGLGRRPYYAESLSPRLSHGFGELRVLYRGPWKYIHGPRPELFHLVDDPRELDDRLADEPELGGRMRAGLQELLDEHAAQDAGDASFEADEETRRRLAALGYLSTAEGENAEVTETLRSDGEVPQDNVAYVNLTLRLRGEVDRGAFRQAKRTLDRLLAVAPGNPYYRGKLAAAHLGLGELEEAARVVEATEIVSAANVDDFLAVARGLWDAGETERGLTMARRLVGEEETPEGLLVLAELAAEAGDDEAAELAARRALELDPDHLPARLALAERYLEAGEAGRAEEELAAALEQRPLDPRANLVSGRRLAAAGRPEEALARIARAARLAPQLCAAHLEEAELLAELGREVEAEAVREAMPAACREEEGGKPEPEVAATTAPEPAPRPAPAAGPTVAEWRGGELTLAELESALVGNRSPACVQAQAAGASREEILACYRELAEGLALDEILLAEVEDLDAAIAELDADHTIRRGAYLQAHRRQLAASIEVTEAEIEAHYAAHRDDYRRPGNATLWNIFRRHRDPADREATFELLRRVRERFLGGETWAELAREVSDSESRRRGGVVGRVEEGQLPQRLEQVVFALEPGGVSEPVAVRGGAVLLHVGDVVPAVQLELAEVRERIRNELVGAAVDAAVAARLEELEAPPGSLTLSPEELFAALDAGDPERPDTERPDPERPVLRIDTLSITAGELREAAGLPPGSAVAELDEEQRDGLLERYRRLQERELLYRDLRSSAGEELERAAEEEVRELARRMIVDRRLREAMERRAEAAPEALRRHFEDNRPHYQAPLAFELHVWNLPFGDDPPSQLARMEAMRQRLAAGELDLPAAAAELGGSVEHLGWKEFGELATLLPDKAHRTLPQTDPHGYTVPYQDGDALHLIWIEERHDPRPLDFEEAAEEVREDYVERFEQTLYRQVADARLAEVGFAFDVEAVLAALEGGGASTRTAELE